MIIVMKPHAPEEAVKQVASLIEKHGLETHLSQGRQVTIIGVVGDKNKLCCDNILLLPYVDKLIPVTESYKLSNKKFHPEATRIKVKDLEIGPDTLTVMAGPCAVEGEEQLMSVAKAVKKVGENAKVAIRNIRRDAMDEAKKQEKAKEITEDELKGLEKEIQKVTDDAVKHVDEMTAHKEKELMEV